MNLFEFFNKPVTGQLLWESKNTHLEHLEDNIFNKGRVGAQEAIDYLYSVHEMLEGSSEQAMRITTKWDGAPAIIAGKDPETGKFFVGTKGVFAKRTPKINFTVEDIKRNHPAEGLQVKLISALETLSKLNWNTVAQGDMLWSDASEFSTQKIDGETYVIFTPNTITYAVPANSDLAKQMMSAKLGIVWHTEYTGGPTLADTEAQFGFDHKQLGNVSSVWHRDATIENLSGTVTLTQAESDTIMQAISEADSYLKRIDPATFEWLSTGTDTIGKDFLQQLKAHANNQVRQGHFDEPTKFAKDFVSKYVNFMIKKINGYKTEKKQEETRVAMEQGVEFIKSHLPQIISVYDLYLKVIEAKVILIRKLAQIKQIDTFVQTDKGFEVTGEEGFVAVDQTGSALKLVDRLEFSRLNFGSGKPGA